MPSMNIAEHFDLPELHDHRAVGIAGPSPCRLKEHIRTKRQDLAERLRTAGCAVNTIGTDWHEAGDLTPPVAPGVAWPCELILVTRSNGESHKSIG